MKTHLLFFLGAFAAGTVVALGVRSALHQPYSEQPVHTESSGYEQMVTNPTAPAPASHEGHGPGSAPAPAAPQTEPSPHDHHGSTSSGATVNSVCPICGMDVDPSIKPATYEGKLVGFGCRMCPPKFARDPQRYGPAALKNEIVD